MSFKEVYGGLQTKVIDGQENTWSNIYGKKFFEVQDGVTESNHGIIDYLLVTSTEWWDGLPADVQTDLARIIAEVSAERNAQSTAVNDEAKAAVIAAGSVVRQLTTEQRTAWVEAMKPVWAQFEGDVGADTISAAQAANATN
jgi:C4-dicarboxylate-binding protein DctP